MAGGASTYQDEDSGTSMISEINVTPLVDVTLVLLIIFMVTAQLIVTRGIKIDTPTTKSGQSIKQSPIVVTIDKTKKLLINGDEFPNDDAIKTEIRRMIAANSQIKDSKPLKAIITADKVVPHGEVMHAIDVVKQSGITRFALTTKAPVAKDSK